MWDNRCKAVRVKDGDTLVVYVDESKKEYADEDLRLFGVWAPESHQVGGPETTAFVENWLAIHDDGSDWPFIRVLMRNRGNTTEQKTFERYVAMFYTKDMNHCLNVEVSNFVQAQGYAGGVGA